MATVVLAFALLFASSVAFSLSGSGTHYAADIETSTLKINEIFQLSIHSSDPSPCSASRIGEVYLQDKLDQVGMLICQGTEWQLMTTTCLSDPWMPLASCGSLTASIIEVITACKGVAPTEFYLEGMTEPVECVEYSGSYYQKVVPTAANLVLGSSQAATNIPPATLITEFTNNTYALGTATEVLRFSSSGAVYNEMMRAYVTMDLSAMPCTDFVLDFTVLAISDGSQPDDTNKWDYWSLDTPTTLDEGNNLLIQDNNLRRVKDVQMSSFSGGRIVDSTHKVAHQVFALSGMEVDSFTIMFCDNTLSTEGIDMVFFALCK